MNPARLSTYEKLGSSQYYLTKPEKWLGIELAYSDLKLYWCRNLFKVNALIIKKLVSWFPVNQLNAFNKTLLSAFTGLIFLFYFNKIKLSFVFKGTGKCYCWLWTTRWFQSSHDGIRCYSMPTKVSWLLQMPTQ